MKKTSLTAGKAALYDPYLETLGGGEKHILSILKVLEDEGYEINIFWDKNLQKQIENRFRLQYVNRLKFLPNIFTARNPVNKLIALQAFNIFFYVTDGSYFFSSAGKNFVFCMVPNKSLYQSSILNRLKTSNYRYLTNSLFTKGWLKKYGLGAEVIYPFLNRDYLDLKIDNLKKENIILSIGRFYSHLHSKKQSILINLFNKLKQSNPLFKNFKLIIAGGLKQEDNRYFSELQTTIKNTSDIELKTNCTFEVMLELYKKSLIYVHLAGYGEDEEKNPERVEHLGITPLEAMASGCLTFCYNAGGPKEIIADGKNGFLFTTEAELINKMTSALSNTLLRDKIKSRAKKYVRDYFNYDLFKKRVKEIIL